MIKKIKLKKRYWLLILWAITCIALGAREFFHVNEGKSQSIGSVRNGSMKNGFIFPWSGENYRYFSPLSYYIMDNGYAHHKVHDAMLYAFKNLASTAPGIQWRLMETNGRNGGNMLIHRTHENGMSVDLMIPKKNGDRQSRFWDRVGMWHYLLDFDDEGGFYLNNNVKLDLENLAKAILAIDDGARQNGLRIRKILLRTRLLDEFYSTKSGKEVRRRKIYIPQRLPYWVDRVHDDHIHVDFEIN